MDYFDGEITYDENRTMCRCRFNSSQSVNSTNSLWEGSWEPSLVTGLATGSTFAVVDDLLNYDFNNGTYNSRIVGLLRKVIWPCCTDSILPCCTALGRTCWDSTTNCCGTCVRGINQCCKSSKCCKKHDKNKVDINLDTASGVIEGK